MACIVFQLGSNSLVNLIFVLEMPIGNEKSSIRAPGDVVNTGFALH